MYLSRLHLNRSRLAVLWASNPYRVHQRLMTACDHDPRLLFRIEENEGDVTILVQSQNCPDWRAAFGDFAVLQTPPEQKSFEPALQTEKRYRFRLLANPTAKKTVEREEEKHKMRIGLFSEESQRDWLTRKFEQAGAELIECKIVPRGRQYSRKNPAKDENHQTHLAVLFEGILMAHDPERLKSALISGVGSAKGYGFGLLSLAPAG